MYVLVLLLAVGWAGGQASGRCGNSGTVFQVGRVGDAESS